MKVSRRERLSEYDAEIGKKRLTLILVLVLTLAVALYAIASGSITLSIGEIMRTIFGKGDVASNTVIFGIRLPRVV